MKSKFFKKLAESFSAHHAAMPSLLPWMGALGAVSLTLFYLFRMSGVLPPRYDDIALRSVAIVLCMIAALRAS